MLTNIFMSSLVSSLYNLISLVSGQEFNPLWQERLPFILQGVIFVAVATVVFYFIYRRYFGKEIKLEKMWFVVTGLLFSLVFVRFIIFHFAKGYIPDRLVLYVLPSPRAESLLWFCLPILIFSIFMRFRQKIEALPHRWFLAVIYFIFVAFTLSVAGIREGVASIIDPFTRTFWEYSGYVPFVHSIYDFLHSYVVLNPQIAAHMVTHPPGYILFLYIISQLFSTSTLSLVVALVLVVGLTVFVLYFLWRQFLTEQEARRALQIFIFVPSVVMFTATSMESFFMFLVWSAIAICFIGWKKGSVASLLGGAVVAAALFSNFLFLLLAPFFVLLAWYRISILGNRLRTYAGILYSLVGFTIFFFALYYYTGYSIVDNFFIARLANKSAVASNYESLTKYGIYLFMSLTDFVLSLGLPYLYLFFKDPARSWREGFVWFRAGALLVCFFLIIGVFQGETARLWLFLTPFFVLGKRGLLAGGEKNFSAFLALSVFQIVIVQTVFYTYW